MRKWIYLVLVGLQLWVQAGAAIDIRHFASMEQERQYRELTEQLRCPKCQNTSIADSNSIIAADMRTKVYQMMEQGQDKKHIIDYMVARYGYFVTYTPPLNPLTIFLWLGPLLVVVIGGALIILRAARRSRDGTSPRRSRDERRRVAALLETPTTEPVARQPITRWVLAPGVLALVAITLVLYASTGGISQVWRWQQTVDAMPALRARIMASDARQLSSNDLARLAVGLRAALQRQPDNIQNWLFLGHLGVALGNTTMATQAFGRAYQLAPDDGVIDLDYAGVLIRSTDAGDNQEGVRILQRRVQQQPDNLMAVNLLAIGEYQQNDVVPALTLWRHMLTLLPANDGRVDAIRRAIAQAEAQSDLATATLKIVVTLSPDASAQLPASGTVFISVTDGKSQVPVAVKPLPLSRFPLSLSLDDSNAMMPERLLSAQQQVKVRVRIAKDGSAKAKRGDWFGESRMLNVNGIGQIAVRIDRQIP